MENTMEETNDKVVDNLGREIHIGDIVFADVPYRFCRVKSFRKVNDRGTLFTFVILDGWAEPAIPGSLEVTRKEDLDDPRWDMRRQFCKFDAKEEWERIYHDGK